MESRASRVSPVVDDRMRKYMVGSLEEVSYRTYDEYTWLARTARSTSSRSGEHRGGTGGKDITYCSSATPCTMHVFVKLGLWDAGILLAGAGDEFSGIDHVTRRSSVRRSWK